MNHFQRQLIETGKQYVQEVARLKFEKVEKGLFDFVVAAFSGSVAYGFCDELSDIEIEYFISREISEAKLNKLKASFAEHNNSYKNIRISDGITRWKIQMIMDGDLKKFWESFNPYELFEMTHTIPIKDSEDILEKVAQRIKFYPPEILMKVIRGLWITANDSGLYNADYSIQRKRIGEAHIFLYRSLEAIFRLVFILNKEYYPHTKWLTAGLNNLENDFGIMESIADLTQGSIKSRYNYLVKVIKNIGEYLERKKILEKKECNKNPWENLKKPYYVFSTF